MSLQFGQIQEMKNRAYRHGVVNAQIEIDLPLQIRALRKQRNWTQPQLAAITAMKQPRISNMEKPGKTHFSLETLRRLAEAFDVALAIRFAPFGELLEWTDRFSPDDFHVPSFEQELPELEAKCVRSAANLGSGAELSALVTPASPRGSGRDLPDLKAARPVYLSHPPGAEFFRCVIEAQAARDACLASYAGQLKENAKAASRLLESAGLTGNTTVAGLMEALGRASRSANQSQGTTAGGAAYIHGLTSSIEKQSETTLPQGKPAGIETESAQDRLGAYSSSLRKVVSIESYRSVPRIAGNLALSKIASWETTADAR